ncbi:MAG: hypothetical protein FWG88_07315 [Oscillospiraceae bacterium]|nr:hypothetical protein [Oscillospiraceae bacterium]
MKKKRDNNHKKISCIALALIIAIGLLSPVLKQSASASSYSVGTDALNPAPSAITKIFKMPTGTTTPTASFRFIFQPIGINELTDPATIATMPPISDKLINFSAADDISGSGVSIFTSGDVKSVVKESSDLSSDPLIVWPGVGVYKYYVSETQVSHTSIPGLSTMENADAVYSQARYIVEFWVDLDSSSQLFVKYVNAITVAGFIDEYYPGDPGGSKVDPTPGEDRTNPYVTIEDGFSQLIFTNRFWKSDGTGPDTPDVNALEITKSIDGMDDDPLRFDRYFTFTIKVTQPSLISATQSYKAYVLNASGVKVISNDNYPGIPVDGLIEFVSGTEEVVKLKHGERLAFVDLHIGSRVEVMEAADALYRPSYQRTFAGTSVFVGTAGASWGFPRAATPVDAAPHYLPEGNGNKANFINTRVNATPTGVKVDDLPYVLLLGLAPTSLAGYIIVKARKKTRD